jgi:FemAB-related protein (PEP-CTERM system-associated)
MNVGGQRSRRGRKQPVEPKGAKPGRAGTDVSSATLAHAPEWRTIIQQAYGHEPLYVTAEDDEGRIGSLPAIVVRRPFLGPIVSSMPFLDTGGPCSPSPALSHSLVERLIDRARSLGARLVELRATERLELPQPPMVHKVSMVLELPADADTLWRAIDKSHRNHVRKAERAGLSVEFGGLEHLPAFYDIFATRMAELGSPVHSFGFLRAVMRTFNDRARIALVRKGSVPVGGLVALAFKDRLAVPWSTCRKEYFPLCPNNLLYWETLRTACAEGFRSFDFGRSSRGSGTHHFKRQWGAREEPLFWYSIPIGGRRSVQRSTGSNVSRMARVATSAWSRLPRRVARRLGPSIRKYLTQ